MKKINAKFIGYYAGGDPQLDTLKRILSESYEIEESERPDYLFCGGFSREHYWHDCVKIVQVGENYVPDFNAFDYAIGMNHLDFGDRYLRIPHFAYYPEYKNLAMRNSASDEELLNRGFCSFVVSNGNRGDPLRAEFFHRLSKYKQVSSGGRYLNNVGGPVADKLDFCSRFKFNIAFENSVSDGYTTEKVMQPLTVNSVPIYFGNPNVSEDFNESCMVRVRDREDVECAVEEIIRLDCDDAAYLAKCRANPLPGVDVDLYDRKLTDFLRHIIEQPIEQAKRISRFGYQNDINAQMRHMVRVNELMRKFKVYRMVDIWRNMKVW